jgi:hypothetical protein
MEKSVAEIIEKEHNVCVDPEIDMFTTGDRSDDYGWMPVPQQWIDDLWLIG